MTKRRRHPIEPLTLSFLAGWVALNAGFISILPDHPNYEKIGPLTTFVIFGGVFSFVSFFDFIFIAVPCYFILGRFPKLRWWHWTACGAALFPLSVPLWCIFHPISDVAEVLSYFAFATVPGSGSFYVLYRLTPRHPIV